MANTCANSSEDSLVNLSGSGAGPRPAEQSGSDLPPPEGRSSRPGPAHTLPARFPVVIIHVFRLPCLQTQPSPPGHPTAFVSAAPASNTRWARASTHTAVLSWAVQTLRPEAPGRPPPLPQISRGALIPADSRCPPTWQSSVDLSTRLSGGSRPLETWVLSPGAQAQACPRTMVVLSHGDSLGLLLI